MHRFKLLHFFFLKTEVPFLLFHRTILKQLKKKKWTTFHNGSSKLFCCSQFILLTSTGWACAVNQALGVGGGGNKHRPGPTLMELTSQYMSSCFILTKSWLPDASIPYLDPRWPSVCVCVCVRIQKHTHRWRKLKETRELGPDANVRHRTV